MSSRSIFNCNTKQRVLHQISKVWLAVRFWPGWLNISYKIWNRSSSTATTKGICRKRTRRKNFQNRCSLNSVSARTTVLVHEKDNHWCDLSNEQFDLKLTYIASLIILKVLFLLLKDFWIDYSGVFATLTHFMCFRVLCRLLLLPRCVFLFVFNCLCAKHSALNSTSLCRKRSRNRQKDFHKKITGAVVSWIKDVWWDFWRLSAVQLLSCHMLFTVLQHFDIMKLVFDYKAVLCRALYSVWNGFFSSTNLMRYRSYHKSVALIFVFMI